MSVPLIENVTPGEYRNPVTRNFSTTPVSFPDLDTDNYDYTLVHNSSYTSTHTTYTTMTLNGVASPAYRKYAMYGNVSSAAAVKSDANARFVDYLGVPSSTPSLFVTRITGGDGAEVHGDLLGTAVWNTSHLMFKGAAYYQTIGNVTSLEIKHGTSTSVTFHPRLYRTPKKGHMEGYELVKEVEITSRDLQTNPVIFGGGSDTEGVEVNGDLHDEYVVETQLDVATVIRLNNDAGASNYIYQYLQNSGGALSSASGSISGIIAWAKSVTTVATDKAQGYRVSNTAGSLTSAAQQRNYSTWWANTPDNVTSIEVTDTVTTPHTGFIRLYRKLPSGSFDGLPWEKVGRVDFDGDFLAGHTFSDLDGDATYLYKVKSSFVQNSAGAILSLVARPNGDSTSNYKREYLAGITTAASAAYTSSATGMVLTSCDSLTHPGQGDLYIYPKSGTRRPSLNTQNRFNDAAQSVLQYYGQWWNNTPDNITSLLVQATASTSIKGFVELYRLPL